ncbi:unnamed protein product [Cochlearia groenlandica]
MSEASRRSRVTITLGRSGQVVSRDGSDIDTGYELPRAGTKRSVKERLGNQIDCSSSYGSDGVSKRLFLPHLSSLFIMSTAQSALCILSSVIGKNDLRFKLMQKNAQRRAQNDEGSTMDLREKLSRSEQPPRSLDTRPRMSETRDGPLPPSRVARGSSSSSYAPWALDDIRRRSPERFMSNSRGISPPRNAGSSPSRNIDEFHGRSRMLDDVRATPYTVRGVLNSQAPASGTSFARPMLPPPVPNPHPLPPLSQLPPLGSMMPNSHFPAQEPLTVDSFLNSIELGKYSLAFKREEVDMTTIMQMKESDLKDLIIPMGPRKKILQAIACLPKR